MEKGLAERRPKQYYVEDIERLWIEYDRQTDTLYIYFADKNEEPEEALLVGEDIIVGVKGDKLLSITVNEFSRRIGLEKY
ncbi:DUF2283 domain-containing protein [Hyperthermus butylicus]|uniref:DUF2283 domain-containing protein n=1 Tax=Hyperthermus butylicus (strain DSM 5456 / JCM 9403 / PLM1-5) TaxID=415426 RepID=A2BM04_HYPBU|nr:DUF2283 domain-containing protein [Hyperthermus butylicus]ABM81015.1 hypothetical protein Hbut_1181 [Hyperthermus butylicus DSM 5456]